MVSGSSKASETRPSLTREPDRHGAGREPVKHPSLLSNCGPLAHQLRFSSCENKFLGVVHATQQIASCASFQARSTVPPSRQFNAPADGCNAPGAGTGGELPCKTSLEAVALIAP